ncbi:hypothetical protein KW782_00315 [Candidatus Parcubacteria bacterium]|nr:hypothetical protein [Candidatus Parcubacteria bacterium]
MSKSTLKKEIQHEIIKINKLIDKKILRGLPYTREARHHKILLARLGILNRTSWLARSMRVAASFMF